MRIPALIAVLGLLSFGLGGCGFTPLYASPGVSPGLSAIETIAPEGRAGALLRGSLDDALARDGSPAAEPPALTPPNAAAAGVRVRGAGRPRGGRSSATRRRWASRRERDRTTAGRLRQPRRVRCARADAAGCFPE